MSFNEVEERKFSYVCDDFSMTKTSIKVRHFRKLLIFAASGDFMLKDQLYKQIYSVVLWSPFVPTLSNLVVGFLER